ncbi:MAG: hypothetical protein J7L12_03545 [Desulfurococcales archaeon]|nr:hypothetical protein [Desulfurococcales archaeon]
MIKILKNEDVTKVIAFIPPGHVHTRLMIILRNGDIVVLQHATIDGIIRAFTAVSLHPVRRAFELVGKYVPKNKRKPGFAEWQLIESGRSESDVLNEVAKLLGDSK